VEFVNAEVVFTSSNRDTDLLPELGVLLERETRQGFFQPRTAEAFWSHNVQTGDWGIAWRLRCWAFDVFRGGRAGSLQFNAS